MVHCQEVDTYGCCMDAGLRAGAVDTRVGGNKIETVHACRVSPCWAPGEFNSVTISTISGQLAQNLLTTGARSFMVRVLWGRNFVLD